jgi:hypothetical protein
VAVRAVHLRCLPMAAVETPGHDCAHADGQSVDDPGHQFAICGFRSK